VAWVNVAELRERVRRMAELACREDGLGPCDVHVSVVRVAGQPTMLIEIEERTPIDGTDPRWEPVRGRKWQDN
jgi:hypothetical protein